MKGTVVLSETIIASAGILISLILVGLVIQLIFSQQTERTYESVFDSLARDITTSIDRAVASAGSIQIQQDIPKGSKFDLQIDYKSVIIKYGDNKAVKNFFVGNTKSISYLFHNPTKLCIVKDVITNQVTITDRDCSCNPYDSFCDPACVLKNTCDRKCVSDNITGMCNPYCSGSGCDLNCYKAWDTGVCAIGCIKPDQRDGICSPSCNNVKKGVCDLDCYYDKHNATNGICDPDCPVSLPQNKFYTTYDGIKVKMSDGVCYAGCVNFTRRDGTTVLKSDEICDEDCKNSQNICDPDCKGSMSSDACINKCATEGNTTEKYPCCDGLIECPGDHVCRKNQPLACCGNGICEGRPGTENGWGPGNKTKWETYYTCSQDCKTDPGTKTSCSGTTAFTESVCYRDILDADGRWIGDEPVWVKDLIKTCNSEAALFLDRRNWKISEVIKSLNDSVPEGWAWDGSRYDNACNNMQDADITTAANEIYNSSISMCCSKSSSCDPRATYDPNVAPVCKGVGYCADHAIATLSILRTLGVPANDTYAVFSGGEGYSRHAWVVMRCDPTLPQSLFPDQCIGNDNKWLSIDATGHFVKLLSQTSYNIMCLWWNDQGIYAQTEGKINSTAGFAYANDTLCSSIDPNNCADRHSDCSYQKLCKDPFHVDCLVP